MSPTRRIKKRGYHRRTKNGKMVYVRPHSQRYQVAGKIGNTPSQLEEAEAVGVFTKLNIFLGKPPETLGEAIYADIDELLPVPILNDVGNLLRIIREKRYRKRQTIDLLVGLVPWIGDILDWWFLYNTNLKIYLDKRKKGLLPKQKKALNKLALTEEFHDGAALSEMTLRQAQDSEGLQRFQRLDNVVFSSLSPENHRHYRFLRQSSIGKLRKRVGSKIKTKVKDPKIREVALLGGIAAIEEGTKVAQMTEEERQAHFQKRKKELLKKGREEIIRRT